MAKTKVENKEMEVKEAAAQEVAEKTVLCQTLGSRYHK